MRYSNQIYTFHKILSGYYQLKSFDKILDLGCGTGVETAFLAQSLQVQVVGLDVNDSFDEKARSAVRLESYDGLHIPFPDEHFDVVYSFHVLEHVQNPPALLKEVRRVIRPGGVAYFGTPNKQRLVGYFGMQDKSFTRKVRQNLVDWKYRITRRFDNEHGAHAGFTMQEMQKMFRPLFRKVYPVTDQYYMIKWPNLKRTVDYLSRANLLKYIVPSVYVLSIK